ncbi:4-methylaminobutanoate oxidase (formaldehyde-forming) [Methylobrevis pamukkalensis]|uniref:4-methylaminobutanoate oxidase (Formaldehyde-forming) n=1 Tax=Methylobrevis pamukkalensis TaxID=1439726 RepID=A0A1E3H7G9_9HYPH|nr:4-methylaminobutanoate oxidase (formaldehyde-forming) [Methylobrevis pamukkalensis]
MREAAPLDLWVVDPARFSAVHDADFVRERTLEAYGKHYEIAWPQLEYESARPRLTSPLYGRLKTRGAVFGSKLGWERANWFAPPGAEPVDRPSQGQANWFEAVGAEHAACREGVVLFDQSSFAKFEIWGRSAAERLEWLAANRIARPVGGLVYTQLLNGRGGIEADVTVARLAADTFYMVTGTGFRTHDGGWLREHLTGGGVAVEDVTEAWSTLTLMGPRARDVLSAVTTADLSSAVFPFGTARLISIADCAVRALRVTYVGELGWELHVPAGNAGTVFDALMMAGAPFGIRLAGYRAIESLRLEKGYRAWGAEITPRDSPFEAGLGWAVKLASGIDFLGREASLAIAAAPLSRRLCGFTVARPDLLLTGRETILRDGEAVGYLASGGWGYTVGTHIGYGYVRRETGVDDAWLRAGSWELVVAGETVAATLAMRPLYDPKGLRIKV